jgi:hypothetical protein
MGTDSMGLKSCDPMFTRGASLNLTQSGTFKNELVGNVADAFFKNFEGIQRLLNMPIALASQGMIVGRLAHVGLVDFLVHLVPADRRAEAEKAYQKEILALGYAREVIHKLANDPLRTLPELPGGDGVIEFIAPDPGVQTNFRLLLSFAISAGWTAFESMTTDLWIDAVNSRPKLLARRLTAALKKREQVDSIGVSLNALSEHGFDISQRLGTVLFPRFDFSKSSGMTSAFAALFGEEAVSILGDDNLKRLAAYRHVIVHRGGRADARFIEATGVEIQEGSLVELRGTETLSLLNSAIAVGTSLLQRVDEWLLRNPV